MTVLFLFLLLFLLMFIGVPIAASLGLAGSITIMLFSPDSVRSLAIKLFETSEHYTLLAIPFFLLSGAFMTTGGVARRLIDFANACVGHIRGGLAIGAVLACMLFAALSGSSPATVAAVGSIAIQRGVGVDVDLDLAGQALLHQFLEQQRALALRRTVGGDMGKLDQDRIGCVCRECAKQRATGEHAGQTTTDERKLHGKLLLFLSERRGRIAVDWPGLYSAVPPR